MKSIKVFVDDFAAALKDAQYLDEAKIINAYPFCQIPTIIKRPIIAVGFDNASLKPNQIGDEIQSGDISVFADIYIPTDMDNKILADILGGICKAATGMNVTAIFSKGIEYEKTANAFVMRNVFTFNDEIDFGGEQGE